MEKRAKYSSLQRQSLLSHPFPQPAGHRKWKSQWNFKLKKMPTNSHPSSLLNAPWDHPPIHTACIPSSVSFLCFVFHVQSLTGLFQGQHVSSTSFCSLLPAPVAVLVQTPIASSSDVFNNRLPSHASSFQSNCCRCCPIYRVPIIGSPQLTAPSPKSTAYDLSLFISDQSSFTISLLTAFLHTCFTLA